MLRLSAPPISWPVAAFSACLVLRTLSVLAAKDRDYVHNRPTYKLARMMMSVDGRLVVMLVLIEANVCVGNGIVAIFVPLSSCFVISSSEL